MFARGEFEIGNAQGLSLPQSAVVLRDGFSYVLRVGPDAKVTQTKVTVGRRWADRIEITGGPKDAHVCASTAGILEEVVRLSGAKNGDAAHPACEATGGEACVFVVSWS